MLAKTTLALLSGATFLAAPARAAAPEKTEPGVQWEQTVEMQMPGMTLPPRTSQFCAPKGNWKEPPKTDDRKDSKCKATEVKREGPRMTWKMVCEGKEPMTGEGEIMQRPDGYTGQMKMHSSRGDMFMKMTGRNLGVACDASETKRTAEAYQKQADQAQLALAAGQAQACADAIQRMSPMVFTVLESCKARTAEFCTRMETRAGYAVLMGNSPSDQAQAGKLCGKDPATLRPRFCAETGKALEAPGAASDASRSSDLRFLAAQCPDESRAVAQQECAGRSYTGEGMDPALRDFCVKYGQKAQAKNQPAASPSQDPTKNPQDAAKKAMKGLFGF